jgi:hypothetical protein
MNENDFSNKLVALLNADVDNISTKAALGLRTFCTVIPGSPSIAL